MPTPIRRSAPRRASAATLALSLAAALSVAIPSSVAPAGAQARSQGGSIPIAHDAQVEALVADYARPLLEAAGLYEGDIEIVLVNDRAFNAFVLDRRIFVNAGLFLHAEGPEEVIAILAHEIGHIAGGHQERLREQLKLAKTKAIVAALAGAGAAIAGGMTGNGQLAGVGQGVMMSAGEAAMRGFLSYKRSEEAAADRAAVRYLEQIGQTPVGLQTTFRRFQRERQFSMDLPNPYLQSHPLPRDRLAAIETLVAKSPHRDKRPSAELRRRHDLARAKVAAYLGGDGATARILEDADQDARDYGLAIGTHLRGDPKRAVERIDDVVKQRPDDPYVHEMRGEILMRGGRAEEALASYRRALELSGGGSAAMRGQIGAALLATGDPKRVADAIAELRRSVVADPAYVEGHRNLARAYQRIGDRAGADLATAEVHALSNRGEEAKVFAKRAQRGLSDGTPSWRRAQDLIDAY